MKLVFSVAITGHRVIDSNNNFDLIDKISSILGVCEKALSFRHDDLVSGSHAAPEFRFITALAEGADQLGASAVVEFRAKAAPWKLDVILPFPKASYLGTMRDERAKAQFTEQLAQADRVLELSDWQIPDTTELSNFDEAGIGLAEYWRDRRYQTIGKLMVARSDLLIAVWDGLPSRGPGGTADVIEMAIRKGVPVVWMDPCGGELRSIAALDNLLATPLLELSDTIRKRSADGGDAAICAALSQVVLPDGSAIARDIDEFAARYATTGPVWKWRGDKFTGSAACLYGLMVWACLLGTGKRSWNFRWGRRGQGWFFWLPVPFVTPIGNQPVTISEPSIQAVDRIGAPQQRIDAIATRIGLHYRSAYIAIFSMASLAVAFALAYLFMPKAKPLFVAAELGILALAAWLFRRLSSARRNTHQRWLDTRYLAERLRGDRLLSWLGASGRRPHETSRRRHSHSEHGGKSHSNWAGWLGNAYAALPPLPSIALDTHRIGNLAREIDSTLKDQEDYHRANAQRLAALHHSLDRIGLYAVAVSAVISACYLLLASGIVILAAPHEGLLYASYSTLSPFAAFLGGVGPAVAATLASIRYHGDFERFSARSGQTARSLGILRDRIVALSEASRGGGASGSASRPLFEDLVDIAEEARLVFDKDLADWHFTYDTRPVPMPG